MPQTQPRPLSDELASAQALVADDMLAVNREIERRLQSDVVLINQMAAYIVNSGGKRLRPLVVLLSSQAFGHTGPDHIHLATIIEFIHTATLLHDDVVDASQMRRGTYGATRPASWSAISSIPVPSK